MTLSNEKFIKSWIEKLKQPDLPGLKSDLAQNVVLVIPGPQDGAIFGTHHGQDAFLDVLGNFSQKVTQTFEITDIVAQKNEVFVVLDETLSPISNPNKKYKNNSAWFFRLNNYQKIFRLYTYDDTFVTHKALRD